MPQGIRNTKKLTGMDIMPRAMRNKGFTLVELSICLIIVGLIAGAIMAGQSLIRGAEIRSFISQKEKYVLAAHNFKQKYNDYLPGDMPPSLAARFGFFEFTGATAGTAGYGDGDGVVDVGAKTSGVEIECTGECWAFWVHLAQARFIDAEPSALPTSKIGAVYLAVGRTYSQMNDFYDAYYGVGNIFAGRQSLAIGDYSQPWMSPMDAFSVDTKIDDGKPASGDVLVEQLDYGPATYGAWWAAAATRSKCTYGGASWMDIASQYNLDEATGAGAIACMPLFRMR